MMKNSSFFIRMVLGILCGLHFSQKLQSLMTSQCPKTEETSAEMLLRSNETIVQVIFRLNSMAKCIFFCLENGKIYPETSFNRSPFFKVISPDTRKSDSVNLAEGSG